MFLKATCLGAMFLAFKAYPVSLIPDDIEIPLKLKSTESIQAVFSSLEQLHNKKTANLWRLRYQKALLLKQKEPLMFCDIMKDLSQTPLFPLKDLALVHSYERCAFNAPPEFLPKQVPKWLRLRLAEAFYKRRKHFTQKESTLKALLYLSKNSPYKELRISYLKHALALFKEMEKASLSDSKEATSSGLNKLNPEAESLLKDKLLAKETTNSSLDKSQEATNSSLAKNKLNAQAISSSLAKDKLNPEATSSGLVKNQVTKEELQELLYKESPSLNPNPLPENYLKIAKDFKTRRHFKKAILFYSKVIDSPEMTFEEKNTAYKDLTRIYRKKYKKQNRIFKNWSNWLLAQNTSQSLTKYYQLRLNVARRYWNRNKNQKALEILTEILTQILKNPEPLAIKQKALYLRGLIYIQEQKPHLGLKDLDEAIQSLRPHKNQHKLLKKILWQKAWLMRHQKQYQQALNSFNLLHKINKNPYTEYRLLFWKGKTLQDMGKKATARQVFSILIRKDHFGYYGLLARKILNKKPEFKKNEQLISNIVNNSLKTKPLPKTQDMNLKKQKSFFSFKKTRDPEYTLNSKTQSGLFKKASKGFFTSGKKNENLIHWLILFKETELLNYFLKFEKQKIVKRKYQSQKDWLKMVWLLTQAKRYLEIFKSLEGMSPSIKKSFLKSHVHLLFPLEYSKEVYQVAKTWDLSPAFIFALIRQESAFNPRARSLADAFGLMQLIPRTAKATAKKFKIPYKNYKTLYNPESNILLGTAHIKSLLKQYDNSFIYSVAAYNAGGKALKRWQTEFKDLEPLEFIEKIPYQETRTYTRLLIRNYVFYHNQLGLEGDWFPDFLLQ